MDSLKVFFINNKQRLENKLYKENYQRDLSWAYLKLRILSHLLLFNLH